MEINRRTKPCISQRGLIPKNVNITVMKYLSISVIALAVTLTACSLLGNAGNDPPDVLRPLAVGNWWEYEIRYIWTDTLRYEVRRQVPVSVRGESYTAFAFNLVPFPAGVPEYYWLYRNGENGLYLMGGIAETDTLFINELEYRYPAKVGETWQVPQLAFSRSSFEFYVSDTLEITLVDDAREVETPAGAFRCYVYKFSLKPAEDVAAVWDYFMYYQPRVGLVMQKAVSQKSNETKEELILIDYEVD